MCSVHPDVLLADFRMPEMDGIELMRRAKEVDPELPVIWITALAEVRGAVEAIRARAHDYLSKPFEHREVIRVVPRALNERGGPATQIVLTQQMSGPPIGAWIISAVCLTVSRSGRATESEPRFLAAGGPGFA